MDVNATIKMNSMIKNLTKHGIISDSDEAMELASKMYNVEKNDKSEEKKADAEKKIVTEESEVKADSITKEEIKHMIDARIIHFLEQHHAAVSKEVEQIWSKMNQIRPEVDKRLSQLRDEICQSAHPSSQMSQPVQAAPAQSPHPRGGDTKQDSVSIEKFFYCGQR